MEIVLSNEIGASPKPDFIFWFDSENTASTTKYGAKN